MIHPQASASLNNPHPQKPERVWPPWWMTCSHLHSTQVVFSLSSLILAMLLISLSHPLFRSLGVEQRAVKESPISAHSPINSYALEHGNQMT